MKSKKKIYFIKTYAWNASSKKKKLESLKLYKTKKNITIVLGVDKNIFSDKKLDQVFQLITMENKLKSNSKIVEIKITDDLYETLIHKQMLHANMNVVTNAIPEINNSAELVLQSGLFASNSLFETSVSLGVLFTFIVLTSYITWYLPPVDF